MATFVTIYKKLNFFGMQFVNGRYVTDDPKQIRILSSVEAKRSNIVRLDPPSQPKPQAVKPKEEEVKEVAVDDSVKKAEKPKRTSDGKFAKKQ